MSSLTGGGCGRGPPVGPEEVGKWFDLDGRLVKEAVMRKTLFEGTGRGTSIMNFL